MSPENPAKDETFTVAQAMGLVRWDYRPEEEDDSLTVPAGAFLQGIPWDASDSPKGKGNSEDS